MPIALVSQGVFQHHIKSPLSVTLNALLNSTSFGVHITFRLDWYIEHESRLFPRVNIAYCGNNGESRWVRQTRGPVEPSKSNTQASRPTKQANAVQASTIKKAITGYNRSTRAFFILQDTPEWVIPLFWAFYLFYHNFWSRGATETPSAPILHSKTSLFRYQQGRSPTEPYWLRYCHLKLTGFENGNTPHSHPFCETKNQSFVPSTLPRPTNVLAHKELEWHYKARKES